jgi:hypothetical protein
MQINPNSISLSDSGFDQCVCKLIAEFLQLRICECLIEKANGFGIRASRRALDEQLVQ